MKNLITAVSVLLLTQTSFGKCIPANEFVPFIGLAAKADKEGILPVGQYSRISPDGKYILRSLSGAYLSNVTLMEIFKQADGTKAARAYETDFSLESFPVQGTWRFLIDAGNNKHYSLGDVVRFQKKAKSQFRAGIAGFYATAAEIPGGTDALRYIRYLSWPSDTGLNGSQGTGQLKTQIVTVKKLENGKYDDVDESREYRLCENLKSSDGYLFSLPMVGVTGTEFAAMPQSPADGKQTMRIYKFGENNKDCERAGDLDVATSKAIFGFPTNTKKAPLVFAVGGAIYYHDREIKRTFNMGNANFPVKADAFPGLTRDGRIVYAATWGQRIGYMIVDPFQADGVKHFKKSYPQYNKELRECITEEEVTKVEAEQAAIYGL